MDAQPSAPPVVVVVVTCDAGYWFEEALESLGGQDYPNLSVLVIDAASSEDPTPRVAGVLPHAYVRRLDERVGYATAANEVLTTVEGASHFLFCHDDVALDPDVVRIMLEESFRSNAGVVSPKLVAWDAPEHLLAVGQSIDKVGVRVDLVERGELDQEQHDSVRDVFCAPSGCILVRADLFVALGGFDVALDLFGEDLDLSWRAQVAGGRVVVAPGARVRHVEAMAHDLRPGWDGRPGAARRSLLSEAHRIRTILCCYGWFHLLRVLPQAVLDTLGHALATVASGHPGALPDTARAWRLALASPRALWASRRRVQRHRAMDDGEVRRLQMRGSARVRTLVRVRAGGDGSSLLRGDVVLPRPWRSRSWRIRTGAWVLVAVVLLVGTRGLLGHRIATIGSLPSGAGGPSRWWSLWTSGWRPQGLGTTAPAPPALAVLSVAGWVLLGSIGLLRQLLVLGPLVIGPFGVYRGTRPLGSPAARAAALVVYAAIPVPYNALAGGRWAGLVVYAAAPWLVLTLARAAGDPPWGSAARPWRAVVGLGLGVALVGAFVPAVLVVVVLIGLGSALGAVLVGGVRAAGRLLLVAVASAVAGAVLLLPWSADVLGSRTALFGVKLGANGRMGLGQVLRFHTGPVGGGALVWAFLAAAALPLLIGQSWRLALAARLWSIAVVCWLTAWAASRGWLPVPLPTPEILLAPAAVCLAVAVALGVMAFELDLPGYRFGWRQVASTVSAVAVVVGSLPVLAAAGGGRWHLAPRDASDALGLVSERSGDGFARVLWVGDPRALPLGSWWLEDGVGYATSDGGLPDAGGLLVPRSAGATPLVGTDLRLARAGQTSTLGHLLAPLAIRFIVVPSRIAPVGGGAAAVPAPTDLLAAFGLQADLRTVSTDPAYTVFENAAWVAGHAVLPDAAVGPSTASGPQASQDAALAGGQALFQGGGTFSFGGPVPADAVVFASHTYDRRWELSVGGAGVARRLAFGWAMAFGPLSQGGTGRLSYHTSIVRPLTIALEALLVLAGIGLLIAGRGRAAGSPDDGGGPTDWLTQEEELAVEGQHRRVRRTPRPLADEADEMWQ